MRRVGAMFALMVIACAAGTSAETTEAIVPVGGSVDASSDFETGYPPARDEPAVSGG